MYDTTHSNYSCGVVLATGVSSVYSDPEHTVRSDVPFSVAIGPAALIGALATVQAAYGQFATDLALGRTPHAVVIPELDPLARGCIVPRGCPLGCTRASLLAAGTRAVSFPGRVPAPATGKRAAPSMKRAQRITSAASRTTSRATTPRTRAPPGLARIRK